MQKTRQKIVEYLREHEEATVDELSTALDDLTAVTVRHHLDVLRGEGLVSQPDVQHRDSPGRPKYVYCLTQKADSLFPRNLQSLTIHMLNELQDRLPEQEINVIFEGVADRMASGIAPGRPDETMEERLDRVAAHLSEHGYDATWDHTAGGYVLTTSNCPYSGVVDAHEELCVLDLRYISRLLGTVPRRLDHVMDGGSNCSYFIADRVEPAFPVA